MVVVVRCALFVDGVGCNSLFVVCCVLLLRVVCCVLRLLVFLLFVIRR